jgi:hypothetical protein
MPCMAQCCSMTACWCAVPQCISMRREGQFTCFKYLAAADLNSAPLEEGEKCMCSGQGRCALISPTTCCKGRGQALCIDSYYAFPCDAEYPCICSVCWFTLFYNFKPVMMFGKTISEIRAKAEGAGSGGDAPVASH